MHLYKSNGFTLHDIVELQTAYWQGDHAIITSMYQSPRTGTVYAYVTIIDHSFHRGQTLKVIIPDEVRKIEE